MSNISIICCYNNPDKMKYLTNSLADQDIDYEPVFIDNSSGRFHCAAAALNYGASQAHCSLLFFVHQDIKFKTRDSLRKLAEKADSLKMHDIAGCAGAVLQDGRKKTITNMTYSPEEKHYPGIFHGDCVNVETVDECLFIMKKETWESHPFDENVCDNWHFYAVEQCLFHRLRGGSVYVYDSEVNHLSETGTLDKTFFRALIRLIKHYKGSYPYIVATTGYWTTRSYYRVIRHIARLIKEKILK